MNVIQDSMIIIATSPVQQTVIPLSVIRFLATVEGGVLLVFMGTNVHKSVQKIVKTLVIEKRVLVAHVKWDTMETNAQISAIMNVRMVVIV